MCTHREPVSFCRNKYFFYKNAKNRPLVRAIDIAVPPVLISLNNRLSLLEANTSAPDNDG